jgi:hypothetical protein
VEYFKNEISHGVGFGYLDRLKNGIKLIFSGGANLLLYHLKTSGVTFLRFQEVIFMVL